MLIVEKMLLKTALLVALILASVSGQLCTNDADCSSAFKCADGVCILRTDNIVGTGYFQIEGSNSVTGGIIAQVGSLEDTIFRQRSQINKLKASESEVKKRVKKLEELLKNQKPTNGDTGAYTKIISKVTELESSTETQSIAIRTLIEKNSKFEQSVKTLQTTIKEVRTKINTNSGKDAEEVKKEVKELEATVNKLSEKITELSNSEKTVLDGLAKLVKDITKQGALIKDSQVLLRVYELETLTRDMTITIQQVTTKVGSEFLTKIEQLREIIKKQAKEIQETKSEAKQTSEKLETFIENQTELIGGLNTKASLVQAQVNKLEKDIKEQTKQITDLTIKESSTSVRVNDLERRFKETSKEITESKVTERVVQLESLVILQKDKITNLKSQESLVTKKLTALESTIVYIKENLEDTTLLKRVNAMYSMLMQHATHIHDLISRESHQLKRISELEKMLKTQINQIKGLTEEGSQLKQRVLSLEAAIESQRHEIKTLANKESENAEEVKNLKSTASIQSKKIVELTQTDVQVLERVSELESLTSSQSNSIKELNVKESNVQRKLQTLETRIREVSNELEETKVLKDIDDLQSMIKDQSRGIRDLTHKKSQCMDKWSKLDSLIQSQSQSINQLTDKESQLSKKVKHLEKMQKEQSLQILFFGVKERTLSNRVTRLDKAIKEQAVKMTERIRQESAIQTKVSQLKSAFQQHSSEINALKTKDSQILAKVTNLEAVIKTHSNKISNLVNEDKNLRRRLSELTALIQKHSNKINEFIRKESQILGRVTNVERTSTSSNSRINELMTKDSTLFNKIKVLTTSTKAQTNEINVLNVKASTSESKIKHFETKVAEIDRKATSTTSICESRIRDLDREIDVATNRVKEIREEVERLKIAIKNLPKKPTKPGPVINVYTTPRAKQTKVCGLSKCWADYCLQFTKKPTSWELRNVKLVTVAGYGQVAKIEGHRPVPITFHRFRGSGYHNRHFQIDMKVKLEEARLPSYAQMALIHNGNRGQADSIAILVNRQGFTFQVTLGTRPQTHKVVIPMALARRESRDGWYYLSLAFHRGKYFRGKVGAYTQTIDDSRKLNQKIKFSPLALQFGESLGRYNYHNFDGFCDYIQIWTCDPN